MYVTFPKSVLAAFFALVTFFRAREAGAQRTARLVEYTNVWKYDQSGADLGTAWREPGYDDSAWAAGPGLFGVESNSPPPYAVPLNSPLDLGQRSTITYYFRTRFRYGDVPFSSGSQLRADIFVDDGCVLYLNGVEAGRVRVPANQNFQTPSGTTSTADEGKSDVIGIDTNLLVVGENVLAVEVHQQAGGSSDVVWRMKLTEVLPEPLAITTQPKSQTIYQAIVDTYGVGPWTDAPSMANPYTVSVDEEPFRVYRLRK